MLNSSITRISSSNSLPNTLVQFLRQLNTYSQKKHQNILVASSTTKTQKRNAAHFKFVPEVSPASLGEVTKMNLCQAVTNALDISLSADKTAGKTVFYFLNFFLKKIKNH
jgi:hypothetical protein